MQNRWLLFVILLASLLVLSACGGDDAGNTDGDDPDGDSSDGDEPDGDKPDGDTDGDALLPDGDTEADGVDPDGDSDDDSDGVDPDGDSDGDSDGDEPDGDADGDSDSDEPDGDGDGESDGDGDADGDTEDDTDGDTEDEIDGDAEGDQPQICTPNLRKCYGNSVFICNASGSGFLAPEDCGTEQFCRAGVCLDQICDPSDALCEDDFNYKVCLNDGSDYGDPISCGADSYCRNGTCHDQICDPDEIGCLGNATATCASDGSGWGAPTNCGANQYCDSGECKDQACVPNTWSCDGDTARRQCLSDGSGFDAPEDCGLGRYCDEGVCYNQLCTPGSIVCEDDNNEKVCNEVGSGYNAPVACENGELCLTNSCLPTVCNPGDTICSGSNVLTCLGSGDGYGLPVACDNDQYCSAGACQDQVCTPQARECNDDGAVIVCNSDGSAWGDPGDCGSNQYCLNGFCWNQECEPAETECVDLGGYHVCEEDGSGWQTAIDCGTEQVCIDGGCVDQICTPGVPQCEGDSIVVCNTTGTGFSSPTACGTGKYCEAGVCYNQICSPSERDCDNANGVIVCNANGSAWGDPTACGQNQTCTDGECLDDQPGILLISEVMYDGLASESDTFVELFGAADMDLDGFSLRGVNGANGETYNTINLTGTVGGDGYFVICPPSAIAAIADEADLMDTDADYQNGPDSIELLWQNQVIDALGYGVFTPGEDVFAGEGDPAPDVSAGHSLARDTNQTDTDDNLSDFTDLDVPTPGAANGATNEGPTAQLSCPAMADIGENLTFNASASTDSDGTIVDYHFDFDDGSTGSGSNPLVYHTYTAADSYTVTLTVTDDDADTDTATCLVVVSDGNSPDVTIVRPIEDLIVTQGNELIIEAGATPAPGRTITQVELLVDGTPTGPADDTVPYRFTYIVPEQAPTGNTIVLQARATDNESGVGVSAGRNLDVRNDPPTATFTAIITGNLEVTVDASGVSDTETAVDDLEVRWDWDNDGSYDTDWSTDKIDVYTYATDGEHTITMQVRDAVFQSDDASRSVNFQMIQDVYGEITTTTWMGTINITGDAWVPAGNTLTIASNTTIVFVQVDTEKSKGNGIGDYDLVINGTLIVNGTEDAPVTFTVLGDNAPAGWNKVELSSSSTGSQIRHAIFEYGYQALRINSDALVENCEFRFNTYGLYLYTSASGVTINDTEVRDSVEHGMYMNGAEMDATNLYLHHNGGSGLFALNGAGSTLTDCTIEQNDGDGVTLEDDTFTIQNSDLVNNAEVGLNLKGDVTGTVTQCQIKYNGLEGVRAIPDGSNSPVMAINYNNIFGNADDGSLTLDTINLSVSSPSSGTGTFTSSTYTTPGGEIIRYIEDAFSETDWYNDIYGYVRRSSDNYNMISRSSSSGYTWTDITSRNTTSIYTLVSDDYNSAYGTMTVRNVAYVSADAHDQVTLISSGDVLDIRHNYFGVWPDVLSVLSYSNSSYLDIEGFVGAAFDESWDKGIYKGGEIIDGNETWSNDVYITGDIDIVSHGLLTIDPGVTVTFVPTDQNGDNRGDWYLINNEGTLDVNGTASDPVHITVLGDVPVNGGFGYIVSKGSNGSATLDHATVEKGNVGLRLESGTMDLDHVTLRDNTTTGLYVYTHGVLTANYLLATLNGTDGVSFTNNQSVANSLTNSTFTYNGANGIYSNNSNFNLTQSNIMYNEVGIRLYSGALGDVSKNNINYNTSDGILATTNGSTDPDNTINDNNIFSNGTEQAGMIEEPSLSVSSSSSSTGTYTSSDYTTGGPMIEFIKAGFSETDWYNDIYGYVRNAANDNNIKSWSSASSGAWSSIASYNATSLYCVVSDDYNSAYGTTTLYKVFFHTSTIDPPRVVEMSAILRAGVLDCTGNYWGVFGSEVADRIIQSDPNVVDFSGFKSTAVSETGPLAE